MLVGSVEYTGIREKSKLLRPSLLRTVENYQEDLGTNDASRTGIRVESILNTLPYFHVTSNFAADFMHDCLEGLCHRVIKLVINHGINSKLFTLISLNFRIHSHKLGKYEKKNIPSPFTKSYLEGESHAG